MIRKAVSDGGDGYDGGAVGPREFLRGAAVAPLALGVAGLVRGQDAVPGADGRFPGLVTRQRKPDKLEFPFPTLDSFLTPNDRFFVWNHFVPPDLKTSDWRLSVEGHFERPFEVGFDDLRKREARTVTSLIECSGNSRALLDPPQVGVRWEQVAVGNAEWTGVPLASRSPVTSSPLRPHTAAYVSWRRMATDLRRVALIVFECV